MRATVLVFSTVLFSIPWTANAAETSRDHLRRADELAQSGKLEQAVQEYTEAIHLRLDDADAWFARGKALEKLERNWDALEDFEEALKYKPGDGAILLERGFVYGQMGDFERGIADLTRALGDTQMARPESARALALRGAAYAKLGRYPEALDDFSKALTASPDDFDLHLARATVYTALNQHERALQDRTQAVRLRPDSAEALLARGGSYHALGLHEKGLADRTEAIHLRPDMAAAWCARGSAYFLLGQYDKAADDLKQAVRLDHGYLEARMVLAKAVSQIPSNIEPQISAANEVEEDTKGSAITQVAADARTAPDSAPAAPDAPYQSFHSAPLAPPPAEVVAASAKPVNPAVSSKAPAKTSQAPVAPPILVAPGEAKSAAAMNQRGRELLYQGKYLEAIAELTAALRDQPNFTLALNARGFGYTLIRDWPHALDDLDEAIRLDPKYVNAYHNRSVARKGAGDLAGSAADDAKVRELTGKK